MKGWIVFLVLIVIFIFIQYNKTSIENFNIIKASFDDEVYKAHAEFKNSKQAVEIMATINKFVMILLKYLIRIGDDSKPEVKRLLVRYDWQKMVENSPNNKENSTSYMEDKGKIFALCLREKNPPHNFHDFNTLYFVVMHELAHLMTVEFGHHRQFWLHFQYLLRRSVEIGIYKPIDYSKHPVVYCGLEINFNPYHEKI